MSRLSIVRLSAGASLAMALMPLSASTRAAAPAQPAQPVQQRPAPPRDAETKDVLGTAVLRGRVVASDNAKPLRRARVTIRAPELGSENQRTTSTNLDGRYEFKNLPAARYRVSVTRGGYLPLDHGQRRPGELGRPVQIADGQTLEKIDFALPRMSTISGRVTDESGDPIEGVRIFATRSMFFEGRRRLVPVGSSSLQTDDEGEYRIARKAIRARELVGGSPRPWLRLVRRRAGRECRR